MSHRTEKIKDRRNFAKNLITLQEVCKKRIASIPPGTHQTKLSQCLECLKKLTSQFKNKKTKSSHRKKIRGLYDPIFKIIQENSEKKAEKAEKSFTNTSFLH